MGFIKVKIEHNKLVRDRIPEIIEAEGKECNTRILSDEEMKLALKNKLKEEAEEFANSDMSIEEMADIFEETIRQYNKPKNVSNWLITETMRLLKEKEMEPDDISFSPKNLAMLVKLCDDGLINSTVAKEVFEKIFNDNVDPEKYIEENGLKQDNNEDAIKAIVTSVIEKNPQSVNDYRNGKDKAIGFLVGQVMKESKGKANPSIVNKILKEML